MDGAVKDYPPAVIDRFISSVFFYFLGLTQRASNSDTFHDAIVSKFEWYVKNDKKVCPKNYSSFFCQ